MAYDESPPAGEEEAITQLIDMLRDKMERERRAPDQVQRDAHPKSHGLVKANFIVHEDVPKHLKVGLFKQARTYPAWIRFSNQNAPPRADKVKDIRGMAIKLMDVDGDKLLDSEKHERTHDFVLISTDVFVTKNVSEFRSLIRSLIKGMLYLLWFFLTHWRVLYNLVTSNKRFGSPLEARYWSTTPYLLGDKHVVKYSAKPQTDVAVSVPSKASDSYMREAMQEILNEKAVAFDFMVQLQTDPRKMPIEDPGKRWKEKDSPFVKLATIEIPMQQFNTDAQIEYGDNLSFTPWHALPEHRPVGGINRARKVIYETLSKFRHEQNNAKREEPGSWDDISAVRVTG